MLTSRRNILIGSLVLLLLVGGIVVVLILRQRNLAGFEQEGDTQIRRSTASKVSDTAELTPEQRQERADAAELEKELPEDIRQTWSPEFKADMEAKIQDRPPLRSSTSTQ